MKKLLFAISLAMLVSHPLFAATTEPSFSLEVDQSGRAQIYKVERGGRKIPVSAGVVTASMNSLIDKLREIACGMPLRPETIEASVGFASLSWSVKELCQK